MFTISIIGEQFILTLFRDILRFKCQVLTLLVDIQFRAQATIFVNRILRIALWNLRQNVAVIFRVLVRAAGEEVMADVLGDLRDPAEEGFSGLGV